jgi:hypothetical protein
LWFTSELLNSVAHSETNSSLRMGKGNIFSDNFVKQNSRIISYEYLLSEILDITCKIYVLKKLTVTVTLCILFTNTKNRVSAVNFTYHKNTREGDHCFQVKIWNIPSWFISRQKGKSKRKFTRHIMK